ncbi:hypothetical protein HOG27_01540, partial [bacterium]|nr:hypothetical protein [bacterium]
IPSVQLSFLPNSNQFHIVELHHAQVCVQITTSGLSQFESISLQSDITTLLLFFNIALFTKFIFSSSLDCTNNSFTTQSLIILDQLYVFNNTLYADTYEPISEFLSKTHS